MRGHICDQARFHLFRFKKFDLKMIIQFSYFILKAVLAKLTYVPWALCQTIFKTKRNQWIT